MRRIVTSQRHAMAAAAGGPPLDTFFDRVIKYIPSDIVGGWVALTGVIASAQTIPAATVLWIVFAVMVALTYVWTLRQTKAPGLLPAKTQALVSTGSFAVWVFALGGPFEHLGWYERVYGSIALILYTLVMGAIVPRE